MNEFTPPLFNLPTDLWRREAPLVRANAIVAQSAGRITTISFDFFDTLVWRLVNKPTDVFCEVAVRLQRQGLLRANITPEDYEVLRRHAECRTREWQAKKDHTWEDISIHDIYSHLKAVVSDPAAAVAVEHGVECDLCVLNPAMASFALHQRHQGRKLIIISDIYFSAEHLRGILRANRVEPEWFDLLVTSCDEGVCKGTGNLFKRALEKARIAPEQVLHVGDNFLPDVLGARKAGVCACHYIQGSPRTVTILDRERVLLGGQVTTFGAQSVRTMATRLQNGSEDQVFFGQMGALIMGPMLTRYAAWACEQFVAGGVRKVGAFMREGEVFGKLLQQEADARGYELQVTPCLSIARRRIWRPSAG